MQRNPCLRSIALSVALLAAGTAGSSGQPLQLHEVPGLDLEQYHTDWMLEHVHATMESSIEGHRGHLRNLEVLDYQHEIFKRLGLLPTVFSGDIPATPEVLELGGHLYRIPTQYLQPPILWLEEKLKSLQGMREAEGGNFMIEHKELGALVKGIRSSRQAGRHSFWTTETVSEGYRHRFGESLWHGRGQLIQGYGLAISGKHESGFYKMSHPEYPGDWVAVRMRPDANQEFSEHAQEFYAGTCMERTLPDDSFMTRCRVSRYFPDLDAIIRFDLSEENLHLFDPVSEALADKLRGWQIRTKN